MGQLVNHGNIGRDLYEAVYKWFGRVPGGLAVTAVVSCAGFGAVTGLSAASVATMGAITLPEMKRYGYNPRISARRRSTEPRVGTECVSTRKSRWSPDH